MAGDSMKYKLIVSAGYYESNNLLFLLVDVIKHRTWHLINGDGWVD